MSNDIFDYSVPVFLRGHGILAELLKKAESHAAERKIAPAVLLTARLFPDMFSLTGQVQAACDTAKRATARLVGVEAPRFEDNEVSFDELHARIRKTTEFVESHPADAFLADRTIEMKMGSGTVSLTASQYLTRFALPNFYFHITTALAIWPPRRGEARLLRLLPRARSADHETLPKTVTYRRRRMRRPIRWYNAMVGALSKTRAGTASRRAPRSYGRRHSGAPEHNHGRGSTGASRRRRSRYSRRASFAHRPWPQAGFQRGFRETSRAHRCAHWTAPASSTRPAPSSPVRRRDRGRSFRACRPQRPTLHRSSAHRSWP